MGQASCRISLNLGWYDVLIIDWDCEFLERTSQRRRALLMYHIGSTWYLQDIAGDADLHLLVQVVIGSFLPWKVIIFLLSFSILWKGVTKPRPLSREGNWAPPTTEGTLYTCCMEFFCKKDLSVLPHEFMYSITLYITQNLHIFILYRGLYPVLHYLFCCSDCPSSGIGSISRTDPVSLWHAPILLLSFGHFLIIRHTRCTRYILQIPCPSPRIRYLSLKPWFC